MKKRAEERVREKASSKNKKNPKSKKRRKQKLSYQVRQRRHPRRLRGVPGLAVDLGKASEAVGAVDVHGAGAADALAVDIFEVFFRG